MNWVPIIFGWPAVVGSILVTSLALARGSSKLALAGVLSALPFMLYMSGTPRFSIVALPIVASHMAAAFALHRHNRSLALILFLPFVGFALFVARLVLKQWAG
jgi:hypothetical protein